MLLILVILYFTSSQKETGKVKSVKMVITKKGNMLTISVEPNIYNKCGFLNNCFSDALVIWFGALVIWFGYHTCHLIGSLSG